MFGVFSDNGGVVNEEEILILANSYSLTQDQIDKAIEDVDENYNGTLDSEKFGLFLESIVNLEEEKSEKKEGKQKQEKDKEASKPEKKKKK